MTNIEENGFEPVEKRKDTSAWNPVRVLQTFVLVAVVLATVFTLWNPYKLFTQGTTQGAVIQPQSDPVLSNQNPIGILVGHWKRDSGYVCESGIVEANVTEAIANQVSIKMEKLGIPVKLLAETDLDLINFQGQALIAIYTGSCESSAENESGFRIGSTLTSYDQDTSNALSVCMGEVYQSATKLDFNYDIITDTHRSFPVFDVINPRTPAIFLELGSLYYDQQILIQESDKVANGIVNGIVCFLDARDL